MEAKIYSLIKTAKNAAKAEYTIKRLIVLADKYHLDLSEIDIAKWYLSNQDDPEIIDSAIIKAVRLFPANTELVLMAAMRFADHYQVNHTTLCNGTESYAIVRHDQYGYIGVTTDTVYEDGCDCTNWCEFDGTYEECKAYIHNQKQ